MRSCEGMYSSLSDIIDFVSSEKRIVECLNSIDWVMEKLCED